MKKRYVIDNEEIDKHGLNSAKISREHLNDLE